MCYISLLSPKNLKFTVKPKIPRFNQSWEAEPSLISNISWNWFNLRTSVVPLRILNSEEKAKNYSFRACKFVFTTNIFFLKNDWRVSLYKYTLVTSYIILNIISIRSYTKIFPFPFLLKFKISNFKSKNACMFNTLEKQ